MRLHAEVRGRLARLAASGAVAGAVAQLVGTAAAGGAQAEVPLGLRVLQRQLRRVGAEVARGPEARRAGVVAAA